MHVLVVEDGALLRRLVVHNLVCRGDRVSEAGTVAGAIECCQADLPDVIVLDITLPDGSGWDVLRHAVACGLSAESVVAISAIQPSRTQLAAFAPVTFLAKPFPIDAFLRAVAHAARKGHRHARVDHPAL